MNTIKAKCYNNVQLEKVAVGAITPGMILEIDSAGEVQAHSTAGGNVMPYVALEDELQGNGISDDYAADDQVQVLVAQRGDEINAILTTSQTIAVGDLLESAGDGTLQKHTPIDITDVYGTTPDKVYCRAVVGEATEAVTTTSATARIVVRIS